MAITVFSFGQQQGTLDNTFDSDGKVITGFGENDYGNSISIAPDEKIVVAGYANSGSNFDFGIAGYNSDGSLDNTFDSDGKVYWFLTGLRQQRCLESSYTRCCT